MRQKRWFGYYVLILLVLGLVIGTLLWSSDSHVGNNRTEAQTAAEPPIIDQDALDTLLPPEAIPAIDDPQFETASKVEDIAEEERIIAVKINGDARAYPLTILSTHEIVNDNVGGEQIAVTWCPLCYSALVFDREVNGRLLSFGVSGKLLQNTLIMIDRETGSFWSQLYSGAVDGEFRGTQLAVYPSILTEWHSWAAENPDGLVLSKKKTCAQFNCGTYAENPRGSYEVDPYASYYKSSDEGVVNRQIPRTEGSSRPKEIVLGVRLNEAARAYPFSLLSQQPVINDQLAGVPILIWFNPTTMTGAAYHREVEGMVLTFQPDDANPNHLVDQETKSLWFGPTGSSEAGILSQTTLRPLISTPAFEFGWYGYFPQSDTYRID